MSKIVLEHIDKYYGVNHVLNDINLTIEDGDFMTLRQDYNPASHFRFGKTAERYHDH